MFYSSLTTIQIYITINIRIPYVAHIRTYLYLCKYAAAGYVGGWGVCGGVGVETFSMYERLLQGDFFVRKKKNCSDLHATTTQVLLFL